MAYIGIQIKKDGYKVNVKLHGPADDFSELGKIIYPRIYDDISDMIDELEKGMRDWYTANKYTMMCGKLANDILDMFKDNEHIIWVEVQLHTSDGVLFGVSSEKVLV